jgi:hypothetical protein
VSSITWRSSGRFPRLGMRRQPTGELCTFDFWP